jgi:transcriptional regulator with XRE-family HTH domain
MKTAALIAKQRQKRKLRQLDVAMELGYKTAQYVSLVERGIAPMPIEHVAKWADVIQINKRQLLNAMVEDYKLRVIKVIKA